MSLPAGTLVGRYQVVEQIGCGGMGDVYRARDPRLSRDIALKILAPALTSDAAAVTRFQREAIAVSALNHPHIVHVYDVGQQAVADGTVFFIAMELIDGVTLRSELARHHDDDRVLRYLIHVAEALAKAHAAGVIHRDLKPDNIMITTDGYAKVLDFGLAKLTNPIPPVDAPTEIRAPHTSAGIIMGTAGYMPPEQAAGRTADRRSDVFSFGCILFEAVTGLPAFHGASVIDTLHEVLHAEPSYERVPASLDPIVRRCLAKEPDDRYPSMDALLSDLRQAAADPAPRRSKPGAARTKPSSARARQIGSIAVLPFRNESGDPDSEYLSDGIAETLINSLSHIPKLRVVPRSTVFRYKHRDDLAAIAAELGVRAVLTGRVTHRSQRIVVAAELIDAEHDAQLWGDHYTRPVSDLLELQKTIATDIAAHLRPKLSGQTHKRVIRIHTEDAEAYQLYLKGRYHLNKRSSDALRRAIEFFQQAIDRDPAYARGYAGLADAWVLLGWYAVERPREAFPRALAAARQAVAIDPSFAEAHTSAAYAMFLADWNATGAEREFQQAIELNSDYAVAHHWYADLLQATGRANEAVAEAKRACQIDPLSLILNAELGRALYYQGDLAAAIDQLKKTLDLEPNFSPALLFLGQAYDRSGRAGDAVAAFERGITMSQNNPIFRAYHGYALAREGDQAAAQQVLDALRAEARLKWMPAFALALVAFAAGNLDACRESMEAAFEERSHWLLYATIDPAFAPLWSDDRFGSLRRRIQLAQS